MVTYCNNIFQNKIRFSYYNNTFRCNKVILATILIDIINLSHYYNKKTTHRCNSLYITPIIFIVVILLVIPDLLVVNYFWWFLFLKDLVTFLYSMQLTSLSGEIHMSVLEITNLRRNPKEDWLNG